MTTPNIITLSPAPHAQVQPGALQAPAGHAAVMFVNVVGASVLTAWDADVAGQAFAVLHTELQRLMRAAGEDGAAAAPSSSLAPADGYAVKMTEGLCVCSFLSADTAVTVALRLVDGLRLSRAWDPALLAHELCEEVVVDNHVFTNTMASPTPHTPEAGVGRSSDTTGLAEVHLNERASPLAHGESAVHSWVLEEAPQRCCGRHRNAILKGLPCGCGRAGHASQEHVLFRGLRLKVGVDAGKVHTTITPGTGRADYRCGPTSLWPSFSLPVAC